MVPLAACCHALSSDWLRAEGEGVPGCVMSKRGMKAYGERERERERLTRSRRQAQ